MDIHIYKYHGTGNDFILIDDREVTFDADTSRVKFLCDRHFGIGADGLMLLQKAEGYDFRMVYYNSDGKESSMCGNGGRCITAFAHKLGLLSSDHASFIATDGPHESLILSSQPGNFTVRLKMKEVNSIEFKGEYTFLNTGSPHYVRETQGLDTMDLVQEARKIRYSDTFAPGGTNVNFIEFHDNIIHIRTYERGVEDETLSCGTGVTAAALYAASVQPDIFISPVVVRAIGGILRVHFQKDGNRFHDVWLEGPAAFVFESNFDLSL
ncbi:MAG: diaminopimelate epimerase [Bacteroidota bacterium]